jgi:rRNA maturation endonuclease Nob1
VSPRINAFQHQGVEWEHYYYGPGLNGQAYQRTCPDGCDRGLLMAPVRACPRCGGSGLIVRRTDPRKDYGEKETTCL